APDYSGAKVMLRQHRINLFQQVGRLDEALTLARQTAQDNPRDSYQQRHFAQMLFNAGDYEAAFA
ncbi:MAG: hypothetical protein NT069_07240, partial [Planctomycetota bacterium]|nr:hypothetical protein [Planctomycetota bacterium]